MKLKGFTLVEVLVVLAILAVMAGAAVPIYTGQIERSYQNEPYTYLNILYTAQKIYALNNGGAFWDGGSNPPVATINTNLNTDLASPVYYTITSVGTAISEMSRTVGSTTTTFTMTYATGQITQT